MKAFKKVGVAGTFAQFHIGHESLLKTAFKLGELVVVAITSDEMVKNKILSEKIPKFESRKQNMIKYLEKHGFLKHAQIVKLEDKYGTAITDKEQDAIVVSEDTYKVAEEINKIRRERALPPLTIISIPLIYSKDNKPISSTRIRTGEIDSKGHLI
ncbi:MAG: phosphopantetheine adenylyltransferase [Candidatus Helarchaeota archaeon]